MLERELKYIICPVCGQEYLPAEIFFPDDLIGKPTEIVKNTSGKIDFYLGDDPNFDEYYICDNCGTKLKIHANVSYKIDTAEDTFNEEYVSKFERPKKLILEESSLFD